MSATDNQDWSSPAEVPFDRLTLRFRDRQVETAYAREYGDRIRGQWRVIAAVAAVLVAIGGLPEFVLLEGADLYRVALLRYGGLVAVLIGAFLFSTTTAFRRHYSSAIVVVMLSLSLGFFAISLHYPLVWDPVRFPGLESRIPFAEAKFVFPQIINLAVLVSGISFGVIPYRAAFPVAAAYLIVLGISQPAIQPSMVTTAYTLVLAVPSYLLVIYGAYRLELLRRSSFSGARVLQLETEKNEALINNVLPPRVAERLKENPAEIAEVHTDVVTMFADVAGFTEFSAKSTPTQVVEFLNDMFSTFDHLASFYGLQKIKTIGDAYMVTAGLDEVREDNLERVIRFAFDLLDLSNSHTLPSGERLGVRIGIDVGDVIAGVIGTRKYAYDLWGHSVNMASRMEIHGKAMHIQVTQAVRDRLGDGFVFSDGKEIDVKGVGLTRTYFLLENRSGSVFGFDSEKASLT